MRPTFAALFTFAAALLIGIVTGFAGRIVHVIGLYEVFAALTISVVAVAMHHALQHRPGPGRFVVAILTTLGWMAAHQWTDAWAFRQEQGQIVAQQTDLLAEDFVVSGADTPLQLVDLGLQADTGIGGVRGALLAQMRAGLVVQRAFGAARVLPLPRWGFALALACQVAFVALVLARALANLAQEPVCATCGRFLRRQKLGSVGCHEVARLAQAWSEGERAMPQLTGAGHNVTATGPGAATIYADTCPSGHSLQPGFAAVRVRGRQLATSAPGPLAALPPIV
jgi:hypothetical protein